MFYVCAFLFLGHIRLLQDIVISIFTHAPQVFDKMPK
jgi:hypothetical protein